MGKQLGAVYSLCIPKDVLKTLGIAEGSQVRLEVKGGQLTVSPDKKACLQTLL